MNILAAIVALWLILLVMSVLTMGTYMLLALMWRKSPKIDFSTMKKGHTEHVYNSPDTF